MASERELKALEQRAEALLKAAAALDQLAEAQDDAVEEGYISDDETAEEMAERVESARDTCKLVAISMTRTMLKDGHVPDFNSDVSTESDSDDRVRGPGFY